MSSGKFDNTTIAKALANIKANTYLIPAIQRSFVWKEEQIENLFDSLMKGYPIGSLLLWKVPSFNKDNKIMTFYKIIDFYDARNSDNDKIEPNTDKEVIAVLDGHIKYRSAWFLYYQKEIRIRKK